MRGRTIKLYIMGEEYKNLKSVELSNWSGKAYIGSRKHVGILQGFEDLTAPGVYCLIAESEDTYQKKIYIGEADEINRRLNEHHKKKDWWEDFIVFISKDSNLTKAHVRYLEKKLHDVASQNKTTIELDNGNTPPGSKLPVSDCDDMDEFNDNIIFILKNLGLLDFTKLSNGDVKEVSPTSDSEIFQMSVSAGKSKEVKVAKLKIENGNYVLLKDSYIRKTEIGSFEKHNYRKLRKQLEQEGYFQEFENDLFLMLKEDILFPSPSAAGAIARNSSVNGRREWKTSQGMSLDEYESKQ